MKPMIDTYQYINYTDFYNQPYVGAEITMSVPSFATLTAIIIPSGQKRGNVEYYNTTAGFWRTHVF